MKRVFSIILVSLLVFTLTMASVPNKVQANSVAQGSWNIGTTVKIDLEKTPGPTWMNLLTDGVKVTSAAKICHPFHGGAYHWVGQIMKLTDGVWTKVATTSDWLPTPEGEYTACADVQPGTYALFGYYDGPAEAPAATCKYDMSSWTAETDYDVESGLAFKVNLTSNIAKGLAASYKVISNDVKYTSPLSESTTTWSYYDSDLKDNVVYAYFSNTKTYTKGFTITIRFTLGNCTKDFTLSY